MDFVIIANAWAAGIANPTSKHRIAMELARRGHRVLWIEGAGMRRPRLTTGTDRIRMGRKLVAAFRGAQRADGPGAEGIWVLSPLLLPLPQWSWVRRFNGWVVRRAALCRGRRLGFRNPALINYVPVLAEAMRGWKEEARTVYHCVDRWDAFQMYDSALMAEMDARCCRYADVVIASSNDLYERCGRLNPNTHRVLHGVDHAHFARALEPRPRPKDLPAGRIIGFFGLLSEWLDQDLIVTVAAAMPECRVVLIGTADVPVTALRGQSNVHLLGARPFRDLPDYIAQFDVGIIPFVVNELTRAVNPIKLREMLAAGCPVVSTNLPEVTALRSQFGVRGSSSFVTVAGTPEEFVASVRERLRHPPALEERRAISGAMAGETWTAKVDEILEIIL